MLSAQATWDVERSFERDDAEGVGEPLTAYLEEARGAFSRNTERALRADVQVFAAWCRQHCREAFPTSAATMVAFVDDMGRVKTPATVRRYVSSIATLHKALRQANPLDSASVRFALQRMHRLRGRRQAQVKGLTWPLRNRLLEAAGDRLIDVRNRALLAVGYDTLLRRSELVSLEVPCTHTGSVVARCRSSRSTSAMRSSSARISSRTLVGTRRNTAGNSVAESSSAGTASTAERAPAGRFTPCSRNRPRRPLIRAVRVLIHCSRTPCRATSPCCSARFTGTAGIKSARAASTNASASARSVLSRRTNGRT